MPYIRIETIDTEGNLHRRVARDYQTAKEYAAEWRVAPPKFFAADHRRLVDVGDGLQFVDTGEYYTKGQRPVYRLMHGNDLVAAFFTEAAIQKRLQKLAKVNPILAAQCVVDKYEPVGDEVFPAVELDPELLQRSTDS